MSCITVSLDTYVRQLLSSGIITIDYVKSKDNIADPLTKGLTREMVAKTSRGNGFKASKQVIIADTLPS